MTGSGGVIGSVLQRGLGRNITEFDLPNYSTTNFQQLIDASRGQDAVIHLAWNKHYDDWLAENFNPENMQSTFNVFEAANLAGVKRIIIASSVHADDFVGDHITDKMLPYSLPTPDSPYGASKCMIEALGRYYAHAKGLEVVCIRFGGINRDDTPPAAPISERQVWLSQRDCINLVSASLDAEAVPGKFAIVYAVSNNAGSVHDTTNPFGWQPQDGAE